MSQEARILPAIDRAALADADNLPLRVERQEVDTQRSVPSEEKRNKVQVKLQKVHLTASPEHYSAVTVFF